MSNSYAGTNAAQQSQVRPMFEVHELDANDGTFERKVISYKKTKDKDTGRIYSRRHEELVKETGGYMVFFPRGHSIRVRDKTDLRRLGFHNQPGFVNMETGDAMPMQQLSLRAMSERKTTLPSMVRMQGQLNEVLADVDE
tara:strand:- start:240 stop:659 length:420 start_codon:yes stop_codon:yes gene_type:complete